MSYIYMKNIGSTFKNKLSTVQFIRRYFSRIKEPPPGKIIDIGSHKIHYQLLGHGKHKVFLTPGIFGTTRLHWRSQLDTLNQDKFTILTYDSPGFGFSSPPEYSQHADGFYRNAEVGEKLTKALGFTKTSLVGWCGGSVLAMILAQRNPQIFEKLVLLTPVYRYYDEQLNVFESHRDLNTWSPEQRDEMVKHDDLEFPQCSWNNWLKTFREIEKIDDGYLCRKEMENIKCPTLIIGSKSDNFVFPETAQQLSKIIKHSKYLEFDNGKHYPHVKYTSKFNQILEDFLLE